MGLGGGGEAGASSGRLSQSRMEVEYASSEWFMSWSLPRNTRDNGIDSASHRIIESSSLNISGDVVGGYIRPLLSWLGLQPEWITPLKESHSFLLSEVLC